MAIDLISTIKGSLLEEYFPAGWDLKALDAICARPASLVTKREPWWNKNFSPIACATQEDFDTMLGHAIALEIATAKKAGKPIAFILPVGPMGMYRWTVYFLK